MLFALAPSPRVYAPLTSVIVSPSSLVVPQGTLATYTISISSTSLPGTTYSLSLSGLVSGAVFRFSPNPVTLSATGTASSSLTIDAGSTPIYCPGTYTFAVTATDTAAPADSLTSATATLSVTPSGPILQVVVSSDKPAYRIGDKVTVLMSVNRPAYGTLTISPPSGSPIISSGVLYGPTSKTLTADRIGRWTVTFQASDFCAGFGSAVAYFDVSPDTYDVSILLSGVPSQVTVNLLVDGQNQGSMAGSEIKKISFKVDTSHVIKVDQTVQGEAGVQYYSVQNTWNVASTGSHTFEYETQYLFTVGTDPDGVAQVTGGGWFKAGSAVQTSQPPDTVAGPPGTQYVFKGWELDGVMQSGKQISLTLDKPHKAIAKYQTQYQLVVDSLGGLGDPKGSGYYDGGSTAEFSVTSPVGLLIQQVFVKWTGDYSGASPKGSITMDKPKVIHAAWTTSYFQLYIALGAAAAVVIITLILLWKRRQGPPLAKKPTPPMPPEGGEQAATASGRLAPGEEVAGGGVKCSSCGAVNDTGQKFCTNCGEEMDEVSSSYA